MPEDSPGVGPKYEVDGILRVEHVPGWREIPGHLRIQPQAAPARTVSGPASQETGAQDLASTLIAEWLWTYAEGTKGCQAGDSAAWSLLAELPQPDHFLRILPGCGGQSFIEAEFYRGAPELIVEVAPSGDECSFPQNKALYAKAGVRESLAVLLEEKEVSWEGWAGDNYAALAQSPDGIRRSLFFPGLWLDVQALLDGNAARLIQVLELGLQTAEHTEFVARLGAR
ncbi:MAG: Uma2 family endonuclease [Planctomycetota bacterium]